VSLATSPVTIRAGVTSTDLWKTLGLVLILFDHWAYYIQPDQDWMHAVGRGALPIFFFLIGFARTRHVPWFWIATGLALTGLDWWHVGGDINDVTLNILLSFALLRWAMPWVDRHVASSGWRLAGLVAVLLALSYPADLVIDYGTSGWLLALVGLLHRRALEAGPDKPRDPAWLARRAVGAVATLLFVANEIHDYELGTVDAFIAAGSIILVSGLLLRFRRLDLAWPIPPAAGLALRFCGRYSLEIYVAQIIGLMALGEVLDLSEEE
jgi:hypothetical protein